VAYTLQPWQVLRTALAGWINRHHQAAIDFVREENRVLLEQHRGRRIRLTDDQRRRFAVPDLVALERRIERRLGFWTIRGPRVRALS